MGLLLLTNLEVIGQSECGRIPISFKKNKLHIDKSPFDNVYVLDNRMESKVFTFSWATYPIKCLDLGRQSDSVIKHYLADALNHLVNGNKTLLVNIKELRITNKAYTIRKAKDNSVLYFRQRSFISFSAETYYQLANGRFRSIVNIDGNYYTYNIIESVNTIIYKILDELLEAASDLDHYGKNSILNSNKKLKYLKDSSHYRYSKDSIDYSIDEIQANTFTKRSSYSILNTKPMSDGIYKTFDDFRENKLGTADLKIAFDKTDSVYRINCTDEKLKKMIDSSWSVSVNGVLYIQLLHNCFLELTKKENTFFFRVPNNLPNMYILLSIEASYSISRHRHVILSELPESTIQMAIHRALFPKISLKDKSSENQRNCFIDMYNGDILY